MNFDFQESKFLASIKPNINSVDELMEELKLKLNFPDYFGSNWDALNDCLTDLFWMNEKIIVIDHCDIPNLSCEDLKIYYEILKDAVTSWKDDENHKLIVKFQIE